MPRGKAIVPVVWMSHTPAVWKHSSINRGAKTEAASAGLVFGGNPSAISPTAVCPSTTARSNTW